MPSFCLRPPGHHSMRSAASGFCVFNNVAIAAQYAKKQYGLERYGDFFISSGMTIPAVLLPSLHLFQGVDS